ncbi:MAG: pseudouridine synthase [Rikenellaceae bacterium]
MFHSFKCDISLLEIPTKFTYPFYYTPHKLTLLAREELVEYISTREQWQKELQQGKMFGVLVAESKEGEIGYFAAFSATLDGKNHHQFFVPPVFDMLEDGGYFRENERLISAINSQILEIENSEEYIKRAKNLAEIKEFAVQQISEKRQKNKLLKSEREKLRKSSNLTEEQRNRLIRESQFQKAELKRVEKEFSTKINESEALFRELTDRVENLKNERKNSSYELQKWIFSQFKMVNGRGEERDLNQIFYEISVNFPPAGAGECAAPKLLNFALKNGFKPIAMGEFWWGESPKGEIRHHLNFYGACRGKCYPILSFMLQGIEVEDSLLAENRDFEIKIVYEDRFMLIVDKPSGLLSVEGRESAQSLCSMLRESRKSDEDLFAVHRLDMATSGLLIFAKKLDIYKQLQMQFMSREVKKRYVALLRGRVAVSLGSINLPLISDYINRPYQKVDFELGKLSITRYEVEGFEKKVVDGVEIELTRLYFYPETGRTHQLRVHSSHKDGLNSPILGDELYGEKADRLYLHAQQLIFCHPVTKQILEINSDTPF